MTYENLELIVVFNGTKDTFDPAEYKGKLVLVTGGYNDATPLIAKDPYLYAIDNDGNYRVINVPGKWVSDIRVLKPGTTNTYTSLQGVAEFSGTNGISVSIDDKYKKLIISGLDLLGTADDGSDKETIRGTRLLVTETKEELEGNSDIDTKDSATIVGAKLYAADKAATAKSEAIANAGSLASSAKNEAINSSRLSIETTPITTGMLKSYTLKQGGVNIGTIDIPKDLVVSSGRVVIGTLNGDTFTEKADGTAYIKLVLSNNDVLYIDASTLVSVYGVSDTKTIDMEISGTTISASIKASSVGGSHLIDKAVTKDKLSLAVQTSLGKADSAVQTVAIAGTGAAHLTQSKSDEEVTLTLNTTDIGDIEKVLIEGGNVGLATASDVYNYISVIMSVKILS